MEIVKKYQAFERFQNDLYDYFLETERCEIEVIEKLLLKNFKGAANQQELSEIMGICARTIRNKYKNGFEIIQ